MLRMTSYCIDRNSFRDHCNSAAFERHGTLARLDFSYGGVKAPAAPANIAIVSYGVPDGHAPHFFPVGQTFDEAAHSEHLNPAESVL